MALEFELVILLTFDLCVLGGFNFKSWLGGRDFSFLRSGSPI